MLPKHTTNLFVGSSFSNGVPNPASSSAHTNRMIIEKERDNHKQDK